MNEENNNLNLNQETQSVPQEPTKKNNIGPIIAILVLLCIVGGGAFFLLTKTDLLTDFDYSIYNLVVMNMNDNLTNIFKKLLF